MQQHEQVEARDDVYCFLIARRAVARAALHLGVLTMSSEALDTLADVLIAYLERFGKRLADSVEQSGRSSAHCNALDALHTTELCSSPAIQRMHIGGSSTSAVRGDSSAGGADSGQNDEATISPLVASDDPTQDMTWKGLAAFCFGPDWSKPERKRNATSQSAGTEPGGGEAEEKEVAVVATAAGGKVGPQTADASIPSAAAASAGEVLGSSDPTGVASAGTLSQHQLRKVGWNAPFPDELPLFPSFSISLAPDLRVANPHPLSLDVTEKEQIDDTKPSSDNDLAKANNHTGDGKNGSSVPDELFTQQSVSWGSLQGQKRARQDADSMDIDTPPRKKRKQDNHDGTWVDDDGRDDGKPAAKKSVRLAEPAASAASNIDSDGDTALYVPNFFPFFPKDSETVGRTILDTIETGIDPSKETKYSPTRLRAKDEDAPKSQPVVEVRSALINLGMRDSYWGSGWDRDDEEPIEQIAVPLGSTATSASESEKGKNKSSVKPQIQPLSGPSLSRVSRILEGSMEPSNIT